MTHKTRTPKESEIVELAFNRFYDGGFHATGVDTVMAESGISKRTLYKYFSSKEDLVEAVLERYADGLRDFFDIELSVADPKKRILEVFDLRRTQMDSEPLRGCLAIKAAQEYAGKNDEIVENARAYCGYVENGFIALCRNAGYDDPVALGKHIQVLFQGAMLLSHVYGNSEPFASAKAALEAMLENAERKEF